MVFSEKLLSEFLEVAQRSKFRKYFSEEDLQELIQQFDFYGEWTDVQTIVNLCRDEKDNFLLALAIDGKADCLITGDKDLLIIGQIEQTKILKYGDFEQLI